MHALDYDWIGDQTRKEEKEDKVPKHFETYISRLLVRNFDVNVTLMQHADLEIVMRSD